MYHIGDKAAHPGHGVCVVKDICERTIAGKTLRYYALVPFMEPNTTILVPIDHASQLLRAPITSDEADDILATLFSTEPEWINDRNRRHQEFLQMLKSSDLHECAQVLKALMQRETHAKLTNADKDFLLKAEKKLFSEIAVAKNLSFDCVLTRVRDRIENGPSVSSGTAQYVVS